jgi:hypothetical protein
MDQLKTYLVGSIQASEDGGAGWRDKLTKSLEDMHFEVLDPCKAECNHSLAPTVEEQKKKLQSLKRGGEWERWDKVMWEIQKNDIVCVNSSEFLIILYDHTKHIGGTVEEIVEANRKHIPMYVVTYSSYIDFNDWILARIRQNFKDGGKIFHNFKQLIYHIENKYHNYIQQYGEYLKNLKEPK